jgi:thimet oligopeptidase
VLQTPELVLSFLHRLLHELHPLALQEVAGLRGEKALDSGREAEQAEVHAWDAGFYMGRLKARMFELESAALSRFFSLSNALRGLHLVFSRLFHCSLRQQPMSPGEDWTEGVRGRHRQEVVKLELWDEDSGQQVGRVYLDLLSRPDKFRGGAAFVVQSARQPEGGAERQLPVMTVVAGFPRPTEAEEEDELRLSHGRLETLFHEMGHVAHHWSAGSRQQTAERCRQTA